MSTFSTRFTLQLPDHWTPQQALAVYELLSDLTDAVWKRYDIALIGLLAPELDPDDPSQPDSFDFDDSIPF